MGILYIFDIDDTLFRTTATVKVRDNCNNIKFLTSSEYNSYELQLDEYFDYSEFRDADLFHNTSEPIHAIWKTAQDALHLVSYNPASNVVIVTARSDFDDKLLFLNTFEKHGLDISRIHVFRAGNINAQNSAEAKKIIIRKLLTTGSFVSTHLFDDHVANLHAFLSLKSEFPDIIFHAFPVCPLGNIMPPIIV